MADSSFDAIIIGGGSKTLTTAAYLAKYGGMKVGMFERRHEIGGGWSSDEGSAPGFLHNPHASTLGDTYFLPLKNDFPDFEEKGGKLAYYPSGLSVICKEDQSCFPIYNHYFDPSGERCLKELVRFSGEKDAETFQKLMELNKPGGELWKAVVEHSHSLPPPPGKPTPLLRWFDSYVSRPDSLVDRRWAALTVYQAANELWEHKGLVWMFLRWIVATGTMIDQAGGLSLLLLFAGLGRDYAFAVGGTHSIAHACQRIFVENGGKFFTNSEVDKILIENGQAKGVRLANGSEIEAKKLVVSGIDPYQLCFRFIGKENLSPKILKKVENLQRTVGGTITWYTFAIHELPKYRAADFNPDINDSHWLVLGAKNPEYLLQEVWWRRLGKHSPGDSMVSWHHHSQYDKSQAPKDKHVAGIEEDAVAAYHLTERQWMEFKKTHAEKMIKVWHDYAPNMTWDNVIGYEASTPYDCAKQLLNMSPNGSFNVIDRIPGQSFPHAPIAELADHRTPVKNLYATGSAWGSGGGNCAQGYTCYKAISQDFGLRKPWEEKGRFY